MVEKQVTDGQQLTDSSGAIHPASERASKVPGTRVLRPTDGVLLDEKSFRLQDVTALAKALVEHTEGKLDRLRNTSQTVAERIRQQAAESRERIDRALEMSQKLIDRRLAESRENARTLESQARDEGYQAGYEKGLREGDARGYEEGLARGHAEGHESGLNEMRLNLAEKLVEDARGALEMVEQLSNKLETAAAEWLRDARNDVLRLVMAVSERVIRQEVRQSPEVIAGVLEVAIDRISDGRRLTVEVHPADLDVASAHLESLKAMLDESTVIQVVKCDEVGRGGCRVISGDAQIDLSIGTQLEILERRLFQGTAAVSAPDEPGGTES